MSKARRGSRLLLALMYALVALVYVSSIFTAPRHEGDEATWIAGSRYLEDYARLSFDPANWARGIWTRGNAPLTFYIAGLGRRLGGFSAAELNQPWKYGHGDAENTAQGRRPSDALLYWARLPMALLAVAAICLTHQVVCACAGSLAGVLWLVLCLASAFFRLTLVRAMCESPLLICVCLALWLAYHALSRAARPGWLTSRRILVVVALFGLVTGLAGSAKLNGLTLLGAGAVLIAILCWLKPGRPSTRWWLLLGALVVLAAATLAPFMALNPYYWPDPLTRMIKTLPHRLRLMDRMTTTDSTAAILTWGQRLRVVPLRVLQSYAAISDAGAGHTVLWFNAVLCLVGLGLLLSLVIDSIRRRGWHPAALAIVLVGAFTSIPSLFTPLDWDRYYLLPVFFSTVAIAVGLTWVASRLRNSSLECSDRA